MAERVAVHDRENLFVYFAEGKLTQTLQDQYTITGSDVRTPEQEYDFENYNHNSRMSLAVTNKDNKPLLSLNAVSPIIQRNNYFCFHETVITMYDGVTDIVAKGFLVFKKNSGKVKIVPMSHDRKTNIKIMRENDHLKILTTLPAIKHQILTMNTYKIGAFNSIKSLIGLDIKQFEREDNKEEINRLRCHQSIYQFYFDAEKQLRISEYTFTDGPNPILLTF